MSTASNRSNPVAFKAALLPEKIDTNLDCDVRELLVTLRTACVAVMRSIDEVEPPLRGRCVEVSYLVRAICGGAIVTGTVASEQHYWNRLRRELR